MGSNGNNGKAENDNQKAGPNGDKQNGGAKTKTHTKHENKQTQTKNNNITVTTIAKKGETVIIILLQQTITFNQHNFNVKLNSLKVCCIHAIKN